MTPKQRPLTNYCGVYAIEHSASGKLYIGSTGRSFRERWTHHKRDLAAGDHHAKKLQHAWTKYGADAFRFYPLLACAPEQVLYYEQRAMDVCAKTMELYNTAPVAGTILGTRYLDNPRVTVIEFEGEKHTLYSLADKFGVCRSRLKNRLGAGWLLHDAVHCGTDEVPEYRQRTMAARHKESTRARAKKYLYAGTEYTIGELARISGAAPNTISLRIDAGWSIAKAVETPHQGRGYVRPKVRLEERVERFEYRGGMLTCGQLSAICGFHPRTVRRRIKLGWSAEDAAHKPLREWPK